VGTAAGVAIGSGKIGGVILGAAAGPAGAVISIGAAILWVAVYAFCVECI
jgi:hypothetical protein